MDYRNIAIGASNCLLLIYCVHGFNLSPQPNYIFTEPILKTFKPKTQSSYFGYSINLRSKSVMVGAPRAQSSAELQRKNNETGAIYKCSFNSPNCELFVVDKSGDANSENNELELNTELKDFQWLGASMDGNLSEDDLFVVCAPRLRGNAPQYDDEYLMHGLCYYTANTLTPALTNARKIAPLRRTDQQHTVVGNENQYLYMYGEQGISVHITENGEEILVGAPGVFEWKGTIIRYKMKPRRNKSQYQNDFDIVVPNPDRWGQVDGDYFGYALASGYFQGLRLKKILYVASAPQANLQKGEVYIFDIVESMETTIQIYHTFDSYQMGEYFGYALAADDFNGDGFYDLAICAPFHSKENSYDNGAVYIYQNLGESTPGKWSTNFVLQSTLVSDYKSGGGRFGSSISRLGDINLDGYNDIAIGAPYENGNGAVYIYLGGANGLIARPSQIITAPYNAKIAPFTPHMFGNSLSKGSDIDKNNYLDLAVGAPNAEAVYVYRSYPVVKIIANVYPLSKELKINDTSLKFRACWSIQSKVLRQARINITIEVDKKFQRVKFIDKTDHLVTVRTATTTEQCQQYDAAVQFLAAHVFKPIEIEMKYSVLDKVSDSGVFCSKCVAVNPFDSKVARTKVVFITGCGNPKCIADLKVSSMVLDPLPYKIGSSHTISLSYKIENFGETAYLAQINITITESASFMKIPSNCQLYDKLQLLCNINNGSPLNKGELGSLNVTLDTTNLDGSELHVKANVSSTGDERNDKDNHVSDIIPLTEYSDVEIKGETNNRLLDLEEGDEFENVVYAYEIRNNGPTPLKHIDVVLSIPILYQNDLLRLNIISVESISIKNEYKNQQFGIEWVESNASAYQYVVDSFSQSVNRYAVKHLNGMDYDSSVAGYHNGVRDEDGSDSGAPMKMEYDRRRRNADEYNETVGYTTSTPNDAINLRNDSNRNRDLENIITNRTILFDCFNSTIPSRCVQAKFSVNNFEARSAPLLIQLQFSIHLGKIDQLFTENIDSFLIRPSIGLVRKDDDEGKKMHVVHSYAYTSYTFIWKQGTVGVWVYIVSFFAGLLALILITYGLYRFGFFRRAKKEELKILVRQSQIARIPKAYAEEEEEKD